MKTIEQITDEIHAVNKWHRKHDILKEWAQSIIKECAGSFECEMEKCEMGSWYNEMYDDKDGDPVHPVLNRQSILNVIKQL
jgi:hypothetical protein